MSNDLVNSMDSMAGELNGAMKAWGEFKDANAKNLKKRDVLNETKMRKISDSIAATMEKKFARVQKEQKALESALNRTSANSGAKDSAKSLEFKKHFTAFLRKGSNHGDSFDHYVNEKSLEIKAMSVDFDPDGGFTVTPQRGGVVKTREFETSPVRALSDGITISTDAYEFTDDSDELDSGWVSEKASRPETATAQFKKRRFNVYEQYAEPRATAQVLEDSEINIEQWLSGKVMEKFERVENSSFVNGNGTSQPRGFLTYPDYSAGGKTAKFEFNALEQSPSGDATLVTADGMITLQNLLKGSYQSRAVWMMQRATFGDVMRLQDLNGQYLFNMSLDKNTGSAFNILTRPVHFADDMPAVAANALSIAYGDFQAGYLVIDRRGITVLRDPFTEKPFIKFYTTKRVGGDVKNFEAIKLMKIEV